VTVDQILIALRRAAENDYPWSVSPHEARALVAEVERLRGEVSYLRACVPPTHPSDYGHEAWSAALVEAKKEGARSAVEERDAERAAVVAWLRAESRVVLGDAKRLLAWASTQVERGEHRREGDK
jgi:hypothetical protein